EVPAGTYTVTATGNGITGSMTVADVIINGENQKVDFNTRVSTVATISGGVFHDLNANGIRNSNEGVLSGRTVFLDNDGDGILDSDELRATTNNDGEYQFKGLRAGTYQIRQVTPDGWQATSPTDDVFEIEVLAGINRTGLLFGSKVANRTPVAQDDELIAEAGFPVTIDVLVNDSDPDGTLDPLSVEITFPSIKGTATVDPNTGHITYTATAGRSGDDILLYSVKDNEGAVSNQAAVQIVISNGPGNSWQNPNQRFDVNGDAAISPIDALIVLNDLDSQGARRMSVPSVTTLPPPYVDVTGDGFLSPLDALQVINELDRIAKSAEGEGESAADAAGFERLESAAMRDTFLATDAAIALLAIESTSDNHRRTQYDSDTNLPLR
ncbi:MAG: cadherin-like domain-containing protein, partial [Planctomycetales bacterium]|nr:cadherin-like domain-containing protein [Planctomycetales bacterium]